jgi:hypothetical protein
MKNTGMKGKGNTGMACRVCDETKERKTKKWNVASCLERRI